MHTFASVERYLLIPLLMIFLGGDFVAAEDLDEKTQCVACGGYHQTADYPENYKGDVLYLCSEVCHRHFVEYREQGKLDEMTWRIEPRSMLFQQDSNPKPQLSNFYLYLGCYVLLGLIFGGLASYVAVQKGLSGWPAFLLGLLVNVVGLCIVWLMPRKEMMFTSEGLSKVPKTRREVECPQCRHPNHPAAKKCNNCEAQLSPAAPSEVALSGLDKE